ncbi:hypothetical protein [Jannaschia donghaensis]|uniref:Glycine zipper family protein n=1 Tax=Jannaschia donghaensis TaxID=420998 RepID=A0A0M6YHJ6_9RHOB|nr:hypothetical protein [Jannaschia donghaensis]CTQ48737.1 hypothetical protein JDO7802_00742 [Jannaschia donghaensis]
MARNAFGVLIFSLALGPAACSEALVPGQKAASVGVPPGDALFANGRDARNFDTFADRFTTIDCRGLDASRAALRTQAEKSGSSSTGIVAGALGALIGGPAGALAQVIGSEASQLVAKSGNVRLAAAEAVHVAKSCDKPPAQRGRPVTPPAFPTLVVPATVET